MAIFGAYPEIFSRAGERQIKIMNINDSNPFYLFFFFGCSPKYNFSLRLYTKSLTNYINLKIHHHNGTQKE